MTYKIIGGDGREYGPITLEEAREWIDDERVGLDTRVWSSEDSRWLPAVERSELKWNFDPELLAPPLLAAKAANAEAQAEVPRPAPLLPRLAAIGCDYVLFTLALQLLTAPFSAEMDELNKAAWDSLSTGKSDPQVLRELLRHFVTAVLPASFVYYGALPAVFGATPGKFIAGLVVVRADGARLSWGRATVRWLASLGCAFTFGFGLLPLLFTPRRQGLHDLIAGTCVVRRSES